MLKICFIGLGSIGCRHLRNLTEILGEKKQMYSIDAVRSSDRKLPADVGAIVNNSFYDIADVPSEYDVIFITNPTSLHYETLLAVRNKARHFFIEKPVFDGIKHDIMMFDDIKGICYIACPLRYMKTLQYLKDLICNEKIFFVDVKCSSYLPEWRTEQDYRKSYSAKRKLGGGVEMDLIHEWDYIVDLFGFPKGVKSINGKYSDLEIDSNDLALYIAEYEDKLVQVHLDYFGRVSKRTIELYTNEDVIIADLLAGKISYLKSGKTINTSEERNSYQKKELETFLEMITGQKQNTNNIEQAMNTLGIAIGE